ncbi:MAG: RNA methyltransferase [Paludibacteraceae bacterium]
MSVSKANIKLVRSLQQKKFRDERGWFVAEGRKCVEELSKAFERVFLFVEGENATAQEIAQMSSLRTPQGVIGVFRKAAEEEGTTCDRPATDPRQTRDRPATDPRQEIPATAACGEHCSTELIVALDGVQDPGNLGTIIRTCDWFGVRHLVCSRDTADCYNPKVVQATMGALARVRVHYTELVPWLEEMRSKGLPVYGTLLNGRNLYEDGAIAERERGVIIMGNEGNGISEAVRRQITHPLLIPPYPADAETSESLNVAIATAVTLAEFRRER